MVEVQSILTAELSAEYISNRVVGEEASCIPPCRPGRGEGGRGAGHRGAEEWEWELGETPVSPWERGRLHVGPNSYVGVSVIMWTK